MKKYTSPITNTRFADIELLRYRVSDFSRLTLKQKTYLYYLTEAALCGRDILFDQNGCYNLRIRKLLESVYTSEKIDKTTKDFAALKEYLQRVWFSSGIHHHYAMDKFLPEFSADYLQDCISCIDLSDLPLREGENIEEMCNELFPVIFNPQIMPKRVNLTDGDDLIATSANNYYGVGVTQQEVESFYAAKKNPDENRPLMWGINSTLKKDADGKVYEEVWRAEGLYGEAITPIIENLLLARPYAESAQQQCIIDLLVDFYRTGDLHTYDEYFIHWLKDVSDDIDFCNVFTETYGDALGIKASWEAIVNIKDFKATQRTEMLSTNAQWFEDNSPVLPLFKKTEVCGVSAKVITAAILAGDLYPSSAIGINLPNSDWIRKDYGSKSVTIGNLTQAYAEAAKQSGMGEEFIIDEETLAMVKKYGSMTDDLHTDLHECLGHGSGKLLPGVSPDALKSYSATIEEARADLFGLYYMADEKMMELGLLPDSEAYKAQYYTYMMNGLLTQLVRIRPGRQIEESHMRNRALIARWVMEKAEKQGVAELVKRQGKIYLKVHSYAPLRKLFACLLAEIQRIKSEGDYDAARLLVERYGVKVDEDLHNEMLERYEHLDLKPYKGFINPRYEVERNSEGEIVEVNIYYDESYEEQMLRYSKDYSYIKV